MRNIFVISLLLAGTAVFAEDEFLAILNRAKSVSKHEGIFRLSEYQKENPKIAATYYHLGVLSDATIADEHPLKNYAELKESLYKTRLYYGNCIHYAKDQTLKTLYYEGINTKSKKLTYEDLKADLTKRIEKVKETERKTQKLYGCYKQLVERYTLCRQIFTSFMEKYSREKNAHLFFSETDQQMLTKLAEQADSIKQDINAFNEALKIFPVNGYHPVFKFEKINLYRLDGLSNTDILQNNIILWDYAEWSRRFLDEQDNTYHSYYNNIDKEYQRLTELQADITSGKKVAFNKNNVLLNLIERIDYGSFMRYYLELKSQSVMLSSDAQNDILRSSEPVSEDKIDEVLNFLYMQYNAKKQAYNYFQQTEMKLSAEQLNKYSSIISKWGVKNDADILMQARKYIELADIAYNTSSQSAYKRLSHLFKPFEQYKNELTEEIMTADSLKYELEGEIVDILPSGENFLVVESGQKVVLINSKGEAISSNTFDTATAFEFAYKLTNNNIAIITKNKCIFIDNKGREK